jgi:hypothetical protein
MLSHFPSVKNPTNTLCNDVGTKVSLFAKLIPIKGIIVRTVSLISNVTLYILFNYYAKLPN